MPSLDCALNGGDDVHACACGLESLPRFEKFGLFEAVFNQRGYFHPGQATIVHNVPPKCSRLQMGRSSQDAHHEENERGSAQRWAALMWRRVFTLT